MHVACPSCGATIPEDASGCRYCSVQSERNSEVEEWSEETATGWGVDSFSLMVALAATAWPVHAALLVWVPPYLRQPESVACSWRSYGVHGPLVACWYCWCLPFTVWPLCSHHLGAVETLVCLHRLQSWGFKLEWSQRAGAWLPLACAGWLVPCLVLPLQPHPCRNSDHQHGHGPGCSASSADPHGGYPTCSEPRIGAHTRSSQHEWSDCSRSDGLAV
jgi:hypothetical protein